MRGSRIHVREVLPVPIYEFYCVKCHAIFNFFSRAVNTTKQPACPRCGRPKLERKMSRFAVSRQRPEPTTENEDLPPGFDEEKMERAMAEMASEAENMNEDDPRQVARMMRKLYQSAGLRMGSGMEEAIRRMEAGEDPEKIEEEMGDLLEEEEPLMGAAEGPAEGKLRGLARRLKPPEVDETLYDL